MKIRTAGFVLLTMVFMIAASTSTATAAKIGYFDIQTVLQQSQWGKRSNEEFKRQSEQIKMEVDEKAKAFRAAREEFEKKKDILDEKARARKLKELQEMQVEGERLLAESNSRLNKLSGELSGPLVEKILEIVRKIGKDDKYDYIFEREKAGIVWGMDKDDLTKKITDELDRASPKR
jgi:outer membrane protein